MNFNEKYLEIFLNTSIERHKIYMRKEQGDSKPWTQSPIFKNYFFCNVFRQLDKCSKWMIKNIIPLNRWELIILFRFLSTYELFELLKSQFDLEKISIEELFIFLNILYAKRRLKFNGCFIRNPMVKGIPVHLHQVPFYIIKEIKEDGGLEKILKLNSLQKLTEYFMKFSGTAGFMGYEYACDFEYTSYFNPIDKFTWANKGPGATRGMSLVLQGNDKLKLSQDKWLAYAKELLPMMQDKFSDEFELHPTVTMREVEHWLCEFQKYVKYFRNYNSGTKCKIRKYRGLL